MKVAMLVFALALVGAPQIFAQAPPACRVLCAPEFKVEPTVTFSNVFGSPRILDEQGTITRDVATGLPKVGDRVGGMQFLDKASPWSFSIVFVVPSGTALMLGGRDARQRAASVAVGPCSFLLAATCCG